MTVDGIRAAADRLRSRVTRTPLRQSRWLSEATGADVWLKLENQQIEGSFKIRGAFNALTHANCTRAVTASAGNHGRAMACAARELGVALTVFVPRSAPRAKRDPILRHGASLVLCGSYDEAEHDARAFADRHDVPYISPYNHPHVIEGAGTVGLEILEDAGGRVTIVVPVGGGGLIGGIAIAAESTGAEIIGVEAAASPVFTSALKAGRLVEVNVKPTLADGLAGNAEPGSVTFDIVRDRHVRIVAIDEAAIAAAMHGLLEHEDERVEGAAAVGVAAMLKGLLPLDGRRVVAVISGGNVDPETLHHEKPGAEREQNRGEQGP